MKAMYYNIIITLLITALKVVVLLESVSDFYEGCHCYKSLVWSVGFVYRQNLLQQ